MERVRNPRRADAGMMQGSKYMQIDEQKWADIKVVESGVARSNERMARYRVEGRDVNDKFVSHHIQRGGYDVILVMHESDYGKETKAIAREPAGEVRPARAKLHGKTGLADLTVKGKDPVVWKALPNKSAEEIVSKLGLLNFTVILGASLTGVRSGEPAPTAA
jgi:hypothetical protein